MIAEPPSDWPADIEARILQELAAVGVHVDYLQGLCTKGSDAPAAIPVLIHWLKVTMHWNIADVIARVFMMPWARCDAVADALCERFASAPDTPQWLTAKWSMGNALSLCATQKHAKPIAQLIADARYDYARGMLLIALVRTNTPEALEVIRGVIPELPFEGISALRRLKNPAAIPVLQPYLNHSHAHIRRAARAAIDRLERLKNG